MFTKKRFTPYIFIFLNFTFFFTVMVFTVHAQTGQSATSNQVITRVGDAPIDQKPGGNWVYYCQADPQWQSNGCNISTSGCGPTSMAMIVSTLGLPTTPLVMDQAFRDTSPTARACGAASSVGNFFSSNWLQSRGFQTRSLPLNSNGRLNLDSAAAALAENFWIIAGSSGETFPCPPHGWCADPNGSVDHVFTIFAVNKDANTISVHDPLNCTQSNPTEQPDGIVKNNTFAIGWATAIKRL